jgi:hypothetical protein
VPTISRREKPRVRRREFEMRLVFMGFKIEVQLGEQNGL